MMCLNKMVRKNLPLILAIALPILLIIVVALSVTLPSLFIKPQFNFLYASSNNYASYRVFSVVDGKLTRVEIKQPIKDAYYEPQVVPQLYLHDVATNSSRQVTFAQAQEFVLDSSPKSPDGFEVVNGSRGEGVMPMMFWSGSDYGVKYIKGNNGSKKLNLQISSDNYYSFEFLGWVK